MELNPWLFHLRHPNLVTIDQPSNSTASCLFSKVDTALILWPPKRTKGMYSRKWYLLSLPWFIIVRWNMSLIPSGRQLNFLSCGREIPVSTQPWSYELWEVESLAIRSIEKSDWLGDSLIDLSSFSCGTPRLWRSCVRHDGQLRPPHEFDVWDLSFNGCKCRKITHAILYYMHIITVCTSVYLNKQSYIYIHIHAVDSHLIFIRTSLLTNLR